MTEYMMIRLAAVMSIAAVITLACVCRKIVSSAGTMLHNEAMHLARHGKRQPV